MNNRVFFGLFLGIFWFLYPPQAYAECKQCKALEARAKAAKEESRELTGWDADKTDWNKKTARSDQPIKVKKKPNPS